MRKKILLIFIVTFALFLTSCDLLKQASTEDNTSTIEETTNDESTTATDESTTTTEQTTTTTEVQSGPILNQVIEDKIQQLIDARSFEMSYHFKIKTDELELNIDPLYKMQKYTDSNDKGIYRASYFNKVMEAFGLEAFDFIIDESNEMIYICNSQTWYQGSFDDVEALVEEPIFDYLFDWENSVDDEIRLEIEYLQNIILNAITNFTSATYVEIIEENDRNLIHYELKYNVYNVMREIFNYYNEQESYPTYYNFEDFLDSNDLTAIFNLFKTFTIDIYFEENDFDIGRIELDFMNILDNDIFINFMTNNAPEEFDIYTLLDYVQDVDLAINIFELNELEEIIIPNDALTGLPIDQFEMPEEQGDPVIPNTTINTPTSTINLTTEASPLTDTEINQAIETLLNAYSYELGFQFKLKTDELELILNPNFSFQKYTENTEEVYQLYYYNKLMEGTGLLPLQLIIDEREEMVYISDANEWYKGSFDEIEYLAEEPIFDYLFDFENQIDSEILSDLQTIQNIILNEIRNYDNVTYIETIDDNNRTLYHYEIDLDVYNIAKQIFEYFNNQEENTPYIDFEDFIQQEDIVDVADLFKTFTIDVYFEENSKEVGRVELDIMNMINNDVIIDKIEESIMDSDLGTTVDVSLLMNYVNDIDFGINIYDINSLQEITIPAEAEDGLPIEYLNAPDGFDPNTVLVSQLGDTLQIDLSEIDYDTFAKFYSFTLNEEQHVSVIFTCNNYYDWAYYDLLDSDFDYIYSKDYLDEKEIYYNLPAGTYYVEVYGEGNGLALLTIDSFDMNATTINLGETKQIDLNNISDDIPEFFTFTITEEKNVSLNMNFNNTFDYASFELYDNDFKYIFQSFNNDSYPTLDNYIRYSYYNYLPAGTYYLKVFGEGTDLANITLDTFDINNTTINLGDTINLDLSNMGNNPYYYTFTLNQQQSISIKRSLQNDFDYVYQRLFDSNFDYINSNEYYDETEYSVYYSLPAGTYNMMVYGEGTGLASLTIETYDIVATQVNIGDTFSIDLNNAELSINPIFYAFTIQQDQNISINISYDELNDWAYFDLLDTNFDYIYCDDWFENIEYFNLPAGTYYISVHGTGDGIVTITTE